ncbi:class I SAM-dependent methyltransferase [Pelagibius marinus]|uniref:class I SAM-dependent methyltransferase n=1 Tax=Pelagibius marinus TaxID=2762760 RepID=UPI0018724C4C|nr:class I SAM-dependent methyltransferase [Pelagibius marinus]
MSEGPSSRFWDRTAQRYARRPIADEAAYRTKLAKTQEYLRPGMEVLEFGCGTGSTALVHAPHVRHIRATDISEKMLEIARDKAAAAEIGNVTFEQAAIDDFQAPDESFDVVLGHSILHLLHDKDAVIAKVHRMLKPGGVFVSSTVCLGDMSVLFRPFLAAGHFLGIFPLVRVFGEGSLVNSLVTAGFLIDHQWRPGKGKATFIVAQKPA